jgi:hypothetical protein
MHLFHSILFCFFASTVVQAVVRQNTERQMTVQLTYYGRQNVLQAYYPVIITDPVVPMQRSGAALLLSGALFAAPAFANLNKYEEAAGGEFGSGTAMQYGSAEAEGRSFDGQVRS